jgi:hypothetical protein
MFFTNEKIFLIFLFTFEEQINRSSDLKQILFTTLSKPTAVGVHVMKTQMVPRTQFPINTHCNEHK